MSNLPSSMFRAACLTACSLASWPAVYHSVDQSSSFRICVDKAMNNKLHPFYPWQLRSSYMRHSEASPSDNLCMFMAPYPAALLVRETCPVWFVRCLLLLVQPSTSLRTKQGFHCVFLAEQSVRCRTFNLAPSMPHLHVDS